MPSGSVVRGLLQLGHYTLTPLSGGERGVGVVVGIVAVLEVIGEGHAVEVLPLAGIDLGVIRTHGYSFCCLTGRV